MPPAPQVVARAYGLVAGLAPIDAIARTPELSIQSP